VHSCWGSSRMLDFSVFTQIITWIRSLFRYLKIHSIFGRICSSFPVFWRTNQSVVMKWVRLEWVRVTPGGGQLLLLWWTYRFIRGIFLSHTINRKCTYKILCYCLVPWLYLQNKDFKPFLGILLCRFVGFSSFCPRKFWNFFLK
jgi:hypothetical protein